MTAPTSDRARVAAALNTGDGWQVVTRTAHRVVYMLPARELWAQADYTADGALHRVVLGQDVLTSRRVDGGRALPEMLRYLGVRPVHGTAHDAATREHHVALAEVIRERRVPRGLSQEALSVAAGCDRQTVNRLENASHTPSLHRLVSLARQLGYPEDRELTSLFAEVEARVLANRAAREAGSDTAGVQPRKIPGVPTSFGGSR